MRDDGPENESQHRKERADGRRHREPHVALDGGHVYLGRSDVGLRPLDAIVQVDDGRAQRRIARGDSDEQIKSFLTARYGDFVLYDPPLSARTLLLWAAPGLLVLLTVGVVVRTVMRRSQQPIDDDESEESA